MSLQKADTVRIGQSVPVHDALTGSVLEIRTFELCNDMKMKREGKKDESGQNGVRINKSEPGRLFFIKSSG